MSVPPPDFSPYKMPDSTNANPEGFTSTSEEKKEVPPNVIPNIKIDYNIMSIQLLTMNISNMNDLNMYQVPPQDVSPLAYLFNNGRPITPSGPPPPPGGPNRSASAEPPKKASPSTGPIGIPRPPDVNLNIRQIPSTLGYSIGNKPVLVTPAPPTIVQSGRQVSAESKSLIDQPPESVRTTSTDSKESVEETSGSPIPSFERESIRGSGLLSLPGPPPPPGGLSYSPVKPPSMPTVHTNKVTYRRIPEIDEILFEKAPPSGTGR
jgi:hypothetical protein